MDEPLRSRTGERWSEFGDVTEVKKGCFVNMIDVVAEAKMRVKPDSQISHGGREGEVVAEKGDGGDVGGTELVRGADVNGFCFGAVQL